jgi:IK cytokine
VDDTYSECYPGTYEGTFEVYEGSDDEDDISKMDLGKKGRLHRQDFSSEEAWSSYNDNREAMPRAAFQFGVKMKDGRKTKKNTKGGEKKLDKDLKKIQEVGCVVIILHMQLDDKV